MVADTHRSPPPTRSLRRRASAAQGRPSYSAHAWVSRVSMTSRRSARALHEMARFFQALALANVAPEFQGGALG